MSELTFPLPADVAMRRAVPADAPQLTALMHASSAYAGIYRAIIADYAVKPRQVEEDLAFVAERAGKIVGFYSLVTENEPELDLMFVADSEQGTGLGRALFMHMAEQARGRGIAGLKIVSNPPARGFYERMGAKFVGMSPPAKRVTWERPILMLSL